MPAAARNAAAAKGAALAAPDPANVSAAADAGLRYVSDAAPGLRRRKAGKGFSYLDADGKRVSDAATLQRIRALAIPPAYTDVWICADPRGHIQATGRDARGRKQYRYHAQWRVRRDHGKFSRVLEFGHGLPTLRRRLGRDLKSPGLPREKVLAIVVSLLAETLIRVGNHEYARSNNSFGLTTLRNRHVKFPRDRAIFPGPPTSTRRYSPAGATVAWREWCRRPTWSIRASANSWPCASWRRQNRGAESRVTFAIGRFAALAQESAA